MSESTVKKNLLLEDSNNITPVKILVSRDINSWMETHDKNSKNPQSNNQPHRQNKFNIHKRLPPKSSARHKNIQTDEQNEKHTPNFEQLKRRKNDLMKTITTKKWMKQNMEDTKPGTVNQNENSCQQKKPIQWFRRLPLVHVNQFITQEYEHKIFQKNTMIPESKPFFKCSTIATRKSSLKRINRKSKQSSPYYHFQESKKRNNSSGVNQIIQEKLCQNNYTGLLASISRKTSNGITTVQQEKNKIRVV